MFAAALGLALGVGLGLGREFMDRSVHDIRALAERIRSPGPRRDSENPARRSRRTGESRHEPSGHPQQGRAGRHRAARALTTTRGPRRERQRGGRDAPRAEALPRTPPAAWTSPATPPPAAAPADRAGARARPVGRRAGSAPGRRARAASLAAAHRSARASSARKTDARSARSS
jgi:hypothetical protein